MWIRFAGKWAGILSIVAGANYYLEEVNIEPVHLLLPTSFILSALGTWTDRHLLRSWGGTTVALVDLFIAALTVYGLQFVFPLYYNIDTSGALTIGLLFAAFEWWWHRMLALRYQR